MGKRDVISKIYLGAADRIADLLNNEFFEGSSVVCASDIMNLDSMAARTLKDERNVVHVRIVAQDIVRKVSFGMQVILFAIEEQSDIHYAMPLKILNGDTALYDNQWREIRRRHQKKKDLTGAEYISGFGKEDHLTPVFSAVLYFGEKKWDGPLRLKEMMDLKDLPKSVQEMIADYPIHLIDVRRYPHAERFRTDLRLVFGFLQRTSEPKEFTEFIRKNTKEFSCLRDDTYEMIASMSKTGELKKMKNEVVQKEEYDMCKAIDMLIAEGEERGRRVGEEQGKCIGEEQGIKIARNIFQLYIKGYDQNEIADELHVTLEKVKNVLEGDAKQ